MPSLLHIPVVIWNSITSSGLLLMSGIMLGLSISLVKAQSTNAPDLPPDSLRVSDQEFTLESFLSQVLSDHPIVIQTNLLDDLARQELRMARGKLDPVLKSDFATKEFNDTRYYRTWDSKLEVPLWFPTDLQFGYERNDGKYLNSESSNTSEGLIYAGISVPVGRGLFIDERRAAIRQARLMQDLAEAEQIKEINKLLLSAAKAYWDWYYAYNEYQIISEVEDVALLRYNGVVKQVLNGDIAPFDSLKAYINYQERDVQRVQAQLNLENARLAVSVYLWSSPEDSNDDSIMLPLELSENTVPALTENDNIDLALLTTLQEIAQEGHPELRKIVAKYQQLTIERRLAQEFLKPEINLKYNFLTRPADDGTIVGSDRAEQPFFFNDYKAGIQLYFPLFLRKERGKLAQTNIKLEQVYLDQTYQRQLVTNSILRAYNTLDNLRQVIGQQTNMVEYYQRLLDGELKKFEFGESSIFLVNTRETELLDARIKLLKFQTEREKARIELLYASGVPSLSVPEPKLSE